MTRGMFAKKIEEDPATPVASGTELSFTMSETRHPTEASFFKLSEVFSRHLTHSSAFEAWLLLCIGASTELGVTLMAMDGHEIERLIKQAFPDAHVVVIDMAGDGDHFAARVTSDAFKGKNRIQQHQMVYNALRGQMGGVLHALALETLIPE